jgi:hypothetical protein
MASVSKTVFKPEAQSSFSKPTAHLPNIVDTTCGLQLMPARVFPSTIRLLHFHYTLVLQPAVYYNLLHFYYSFCYPSTASLRHRLPNTTHPLYVHYTSTTLLQHSCTTHCGPSTVDFLLLPSTMNSNVLPYLLHVDYDDTFATFLLQSAKLFVALFVAYLYLCICPSVPVLYPAVPFLLAPALRIMSKCMPHASHDMVF